LLVPRHQEGTRRPIRIVLGLGLAFALTGCGDDGAASDPSSAAGDEEPEEAEPEEAEPEDEVPDNVTIEDPPEGGGMAMVTDPCRVTERVSGTDDGGEEVDRTEEVEVGPREWEPGVAPTALGRTAAVALGGEEVEPEEGEPYVAVTLQPGAAAVRYRFDDQGQAATATIAPEGGSLVYTYTYEYECEANQAPDPNEAPEDG